MSSATLVSYYPIEFHEFIPFIYPSLYRMDPSDGKIPSLLNIEDAFYLLDRSIEDRPSIKVPVAAENLAHSLINDFLTATYLSSMESHPAVFYVPGTITLNELATRYESEIEKNLEAQKRWYWILIQQADDIWQAYRQHKFINDIQRLAAKQLNLDRDWLNVQKDMETCPACFTRVNPGQAVCQNCRCVLNLELFKKLTFAEK